MTRTPYSCAPYGEDKWRNFYAGYLRYYLREGYIEPTSGIFAEALAAAKPVVVTAGTWMAGELGKSGSGVEFESNNIDDLSAQTLHLIRHYREFREKAGALAAASPRAAAALSEAFGVSFAVALAISVLALVPAALLPGRPAAPPPVRSLPAGAT